MEMEQPRQLTPDEQIDRLNKKVNEQNTLINKLTRRGEDVEVNINFDMKALGKEGMDKLFKIESLLHEIGISFDTGAGCDSRDWEWDWSLSGPVQVNFRSFTKDDEKNRYVRGNRTNDSKLKAAKIEKELIEKEFLTEGTCQESD